MSAFFMETALNEKEHAKRFFKFLEGGPVEITAAYPAGIIGDTLANLNAAANGEKEEWTKLYPEFARVAEEEGFKDVAEAYRNIAKVEQAHENRYRKLHDNLEAGKVFVKDGKMIWKCRNCGYLHEGDKAPDVCPSCLHPQAFFELWSENY